MIYICLWLSGSLSVPECIPLEIIEARMDRVREHALVYLSVHLHPSNVDHWLCTYHLHVDAHKYTPNMQCTDSGDYHRP